MNLPKYISWALCGIASVLLLLCMVISAAGMVDETRTIFIITLVCAGLSFAFFRVHLTLEEESRAPEDNKTSSALLKEAMVALEQWEKSDSKEDEKMFHQKARKALLALGDVKLSPRNQAIGAVSEAIAAHRKVMELDPEEDHFEFSIETAHADQLTEKAFRLLRDAL